MNEENPAAPAAAAPPTPPPLPTPPTAGTITLGVKATGRSVTIPEHAAVILLQLLDRISLGGSDLKFSAALAQRALEEAMRVMQAEAAVPAQPPSRQQRRALARAEAPKGIRPE